VKAAQEMSAPMSTAALGLPESPRRRVARRRRGRTRAAGRCSASANDSREYCQSWLAIQCRLIPGVVGGVVLLRLEGAEGYSAVAVWPDVRRDMSYLTPTAQQALMERRGVVVPREDAVDASAASIFIGYPVEAIGVLHGVVVLDVAPRPEAELQAGLRQLHWGAAGLELMLCQQEVVRVGETRDRLQTVLEVVASAAAHERYAGAATALVTDLATRLKCDRVSIGFLHGGQTRIEASQAQFRGTDLLRAVA
jgi:hypothetical protein